MFSMEVDGEKAVAHMRARAEGIPKAMAKVVTALAIKLHTAVTNRAPVLTGKLRRSIFWDTAINPDQAMGRVFVSADTPYARMLEYGGKTKAHDIVPTKAKALHFFVGGKEVFAKVVHHPGSTFKARRYVHGPFEEMQPEIIARIEAAMHEALK